MTYTELIAAIADYTENSFTTVELNTFITQAVPVRNPPAPPPPPV